MQFHTLVGSMIHCEDKYISLRHGIAT